METFLSVCLGLGLAAACGFRVFVPLLVMSVAANAGYLSLTPGFDWIAGDVVAIEPSSSALKIPHMGWNQLNILAPGHPVLAGLAADASAPHAYFVHSYHFAVAERDNVLATAEYGGEVTAMVGRDNMVGTQFHPEKSQATGLRLIANFLDWSP